jgi:hypothetical protein
MNQHHDEHQGATHETSDVHIGTLVKFIVILAVSCVIILIAMKYYSNFLEGQEEQAELPPASRVNPPGTRRLPPMPRLQGAPGSELLPMDEMKKVREEQDLAVKNYSWVDKSAGIVRIPIEEAKKIVLERGMPARAAGAPGAAAPSPSATPAAKINAASPARGH